MGRLYIKPQKSFVKLATLEPRHRGQQWLVAVMFASGVLAWAVGVAYVVAWAWK